MHGIQGNRTWTNQGLDTLGLESWSHTAALTISYPDGGRATWNSTRTNALVPISGTWYYEITGSGSGIAKSGASYTLTINSPLYRVARAWWLNSSSCPWIESGVITITRSNRDNSLVINFGNIGDCNETATATIGDRSYTIERGW